MTTHRDALLATRASRSRLKHIDADRCASLWIAAIEQQIKAAKRGDEESKIWLSRDGLLVVDMIGADAAIYWEQIRDLALS